VKGHAAFFGIIAHTSALLSVRAGVPFWFALPLAGLFTAAIGAILRAISARFHDELPGNNYNRH
jgi:branched-chain amino acid transport system permease protein